MKTMLRLTLCFLWLLPLVALGQGPVTRHYLTVAQLTNIPPNQIISDGRAFADVVGTSGYPGGTFYWDAASTSTVNFSNVFPALQAGRWIRTSYWFANTNLSGTLADTNLYFTLLDSSTVAFTILGTNISAGVVTNSLTTNHIDTAFYDLLTATNGGAADGVGHGTNIFQDGVLVEQANLVDSAQVAVDTMGSDISFSLPTGSISTNKIDAIFHGLLMATNGGVASVEVTGVDGNFITNLNIVSSSDIQWGTFLGTNAIAGINYENIQDAVAAMMVSGANMASINYDDFFGTLTFNASAGGGGTNAFIISVDGSIVNTPNLADAAQISFNVSGSNITASVNANSIALPGDTTGDFVANLSGASGRIQVSGGTGEASTPTVDLATSSITNSGLFSNPDMRIDAYGRVVAITNGVAGSGNRTNIGVKGVDIDLADLDASAEIDFNASGSTITGSLLDGSISTNRIDSVFHGLLVASGAAQQTAVAGTSLIPFNLVAGNGIAVSTSGGSNAIVTATGSLTNGFTLKSAVGVMASNTVDEVFMMSVNVPAGTLSANGDELEIYVPGIYTMYNGSTNVAYSWQFYVNSGDSQGIQQDVSPLTFISSPFAVDWTFRFKRMSSTTFILTGAHRLGGDDNADRTNIVDTLRVVEDDLGTTPDFDTGDVVLELSVSLGLANVAHHMRTFGYTIWKVGGGSEAGSGGDPALVVTATTIFTNDNRALRSNGTNRIAQASSVTIDDSGNIDTPGIISLGSNGVARGAVNFHSETSGLTNKSVQIASIPWSTEAGVQFRPLIPGSELAIDLMPNGTANKVHIDLVNNGDLNSDTNNWEVLAISMFTDRGVISTGQRGTGSFRPLYLSDADITGQRRVHVMNASSGSGSWATFSVLNEDSEDAGLRLMAMGRSFGSSGAFRQDAGVLESGSDLSGGLNITARHPSGGDIRFYTGGFADGSNRMTIAATGDITINNSLLVSNAVTVGTTNVVIALAGKQPLDTDLTTVANLTSGTSTNFFSGDGTFKQVTTNMLPGFVADMANKQPLDDDLTSLAAGTVMATLITNGASIGAPTMIVGTTNIAVSLAAKQPLNTNLLQMATAIPTVGQVYIRAADGNMTNFGTTGSGNILRTRVGIARTLSIPGDSFDVESSEPATAATNVWATTTDRSRWVGWDFSPTTTNGICKSFPMPSTWDLGTVNIKIYWKQVAAEANTTNVWSIGVGTTGDNETGGNTIGTRITILDQGLNNTNNVAITAWSSAITPGGTPASGDDLQISIQRHPGNTSDNMTVGSRIKEVLFEYTESTTEPTDN